ncbi:MAG: hypothetical protein GXO22_08405 [Aquificae bacterium]|nr:hypothetical protein [Aquificota bacterium]
MICLYFHTIKLPTADQIVKKIRYPDGAVEIKESLICLLNITSVNS